MNTTKPDCRARLLVIGHAERVLLDPDAAATVPLKLCPDVTTALQTPPAGLDAVALELAVVEDRPSLALKTLRQRYHPARIILLAGMYEEPLAMELVRSTTDAGPLADDYLIIPVSTQSLYRTCTTAQTPPLHPVADDRIEQRLRHLEKLATEDELTGLKNRRYIREFTRQIINHASRTNGRVTLLLFDVDNLKSYNDTYGHLAGDRILKQAAAVMQRCCRAHDVIGRIGGDEFAVVFWDGPTTTSEKPTDRRSTTTEHPRQAIAIAKRFQKELEKAQPPLLEPATTATLTISGGLASFPRDASNVDQLFQLADQALLEAKRSGKNKIYLAGKPDADITTVQ